MSKTTPKCEDSTNQPIQSKKLKEDSLIRTNKILVIITALVAIANIVLAKVAIDSLNQAKETSKIQLRAYIQVVNVKTTQMKIGKTLEITVYYKNTGQTPAYDIRVQASIKPGGKGLSDLDWERLKEFAPQGNNVLGANSLYDITIPSNIMITDSTTIPLWNNTGKYLGVFGYIYYKDIYGNITHYSRFYLEYWRGKFVFAPSFNDADRYGQKIIENENIKQGSVQWSIITALFTVLIAAIAVGVAVWQGRETRKHNRLSVKPRLRIDIERYKPEEIIYILKNCGTGPAIIKSIHFIVNDQSFDIINKSTCRHILDLFNIDNDRAKVFILSKEAAISVGEEVNLLEISYPSDNTIPIDDINKLTAKLKIEIEYESIYKEGDVAIIDPFLLQP